MVVPFLVGCLWRTPDTYDLAGIRRGTATSNFHAHRDNLQFSGSARSFGPVAASRSHLGRSEHRFSSCVHFTWIADLGRFQLEPEHPGDVQVNGEGLPESKVLGIQLNTISEDLSPHHDSRRLARVVKSNGGV